jgi:hypothetical protein
MIVFANHNILFDILGNILAHHHIRMDLRSGILFRPQSKFVAYEHTP